MKNTISKFFVAAAATAAALSMALLSGCSAQSSSAAPNRLEAIKQRGYLEVATEPYFAPNEFIDASLPAGEQIVGSDMMLAQRIADTIGVELRIVPLEFGAVLAGVAEGKYDMAISALAYTESRAEAMEMSEGYYFDPNSKGYSLLVREEDKDLYKDMSDFDGKIVVCQSGSLQESYALNQMNYKAFKEFVRVSATTDGYLMVSEKKADAAVCAVANAELYCAANPGLTTLAGVIQFEEQYAGTRLGVPKGEKELLEVANKVIAELLESGEYIQWYDQYTEYAAKLGV